VAFTVFTARYAPFLNQTGFAGIQNFVAPLLKSRIEATRAYHTINPNLLFRDKRRGRRKSPAAYSPEPPTSPAPARRAFLIPG
jgi:hypothetical protein